MYSYEEIKLRLENLEKEIIGIKEVLDRREGINRQGYDKYPRKGQIWTAFESDYVATRLRELCQDLGDKTGRGKLSILWRIYLECKKGGCLG